MSNRYRYRYTLYVDIYDYKRDSQLPEMWQKVRATWTTPMTNRKLTNWQLATWLKLLLRLRLPLCRRYSLSLSLSDALSLSVFLSCLSFALCDCDLRLNSVDTSRSQCIRPKCARAKPFAQSWPNLTLSSVVRTDTQIAETQVETPESSVSCPAKRNERSLILGQAGSQQSNWANEQQACGKFFWIKWNRLI